MMDRNRLQAAYAGGERRALTAIFTVVVALFAAPAAAEEQEAKSEAAEARALKYLSAEVPRWSVENKCFSCHNNGDAARALYTAVRMHRTVDSKALADTTDWLVRPQDWKNNRGDPAFSDKTLAAVQFAVALAALKEAGTSQETKAFAEAARIVAGIQQPDGSWRPDGPDAIGSPATWGRALVTAMARNALAILESRSDGNEIQLSDRWLRAARPETVLDAGAVLIGLGQARDEPAMQQRAACLKIVRSGEARQGGWGPYVSSPPEPFDTAVVLVGCAPFLADAALGPFISRGRRYLTASQSPDGSWPETTRPANATSYAQRLSTAGWATQALLLTSEREK